MRTCSDECKFESGGGQMFKMHNSHGAGDINYLPIMVDGTVAPSGGGLRHTELYFTYLPNIIPNIA